ncbi:hypothetical protein XENTR_v10006738 [Xenopus tropicalis]|uniref:Bridging integrator 2 n=1 Tax=Xenopus tropicalis TaxID=8364 RepID=A0A6I8QF03_XENTR|nr:bridging integrator 2 [Xenopus tropicalis]KAE8626762.1 hypothetical protein XENTR_v10006738 [Xenopus tropicalis]|eukprot:XP_002933750.1 PREDICTED: bridging integrator 2 [Xenopus tropicalis]
MAEAKQGGAGGFAKNVQKRFTRAQEKVLQKLGRTLETKDEMFEQCAYLFNQQQNEGNRLYKDLKAVFSAVKAMHESSKRLSETLHVIYKPDWDGYNDLRPIVENDDLLWNDYEEKMSDQVVRIMDNYMAQFPEYRERIAKRGRKMVDYDSARHHLEALQNAKKKDEGKITKAEEEFNKAQSIFEDLNKELREDLPVLYSSRVGCYVTIFKNISNLRDVFYKEMSKLNHELYDVMSKLEKQHSNKVFVIKGVKSNRKSLVISSPISSSSSFFMASIDPEASTPSVNTKSVNQTCENSSLSSNSSETQDSISMDGNFTQSLENSSQETPNELSQSLSDNSGIKNSNEMEQENNMSTMDPMAGNKTDTQKHQEDAKTGKSEEETQAGPYNIIQERSGAIDQNSSAFSSQKGLGELMKRNLEASDEVSDGTTICLSRDQNGDTNKEIDKELNDAKPRELCQKAQVDSQDETHDKKQEFLSTNGLKDTKEKSEIIMKGGTGGSTQMKTAALVDIIQNEDTTQSGVGIKQQEQCEKAGSNDKTQEDSVGWKIESPSLNALMPSKNGLLDITEDQKMSAEGEPLSSAELEQGKAESKTAEPHLPTTLTAGAGLSDESDRNQIIASSHQTPLDCNVSAEKQLHDPFNELGCTAGDINNQDSIEN